MKFTESGEVVIRATVGDASEDHPERATVHFSVSDTGIGLSDEAKIRLFRPFSQADGSTTRRYGGPGLGLSISKRLVELMGGRIGVESRPGLGSDFWFDIPFELGKPVEQVHFDKTGFERTKILVVDDQESALTIMQAYVRSWGMQCDVVNNGRDAIEMIKREASRGTPYDLAITDLVMPGMDGIKLLEEVKKQSSLSHTKMMLCTGYDEKGLAEDAGKKGFAGYLTKPVQQSRLFNSIANVVLNRHVIAEPFASKAEPLGNIDLASDPSVQSLMILLADDNVVNQKVALAQLKKLGLKAVVVPNGRAAVEEVIRRNYALVLMDCQMPELDGFEATAAIRRAELSTGRHIPIIGLTAHAMEGDREKCIESGMDDYLSKPTSLQKLSKALRKWILGEAGNNLVPVPIEEADYTRILDDDVILELTPIFIDDTANCLKMLSDAVAKKDVEEIKSVVHQLKGSCAGVGATKMASICRQIEMMLKEDQSAEVESADLKRLVTSMKKSFEVVKDVLEIQIGVAP
jgi:CheY-like chemotaxis protein/HPt (histidine-containing phosphotransfer) domain-containing protein